MPLAINPCRSLCDWSATRASYDGQELFACGGCGSQWVPSEGWTPMQADGTIPVAVRRAVTSARSAAAADTAGS